MKVLFNATNLRKGGGLQRAVSLCLEMCGDALGCTWHIAVSDAVLDELRQFGADRIDNLHVFRVSPSRSLWNRYRLRSLERSLRPDCVFTVAGPAYVRFRAPHLMGCSSAWLTHFDWGLARETLPIHQCLRNAPASLYKVHWLRAADAWVVQTQSAKQGLSRRLDVPPSRIAVVPNTCGNAYLDHQPATGYRTADKVRFLCFAAPYAHKRLELIPAVARQLAIAAPELDFEFVTTLPPSCGLLRHIVKQAQTLHVSDRIHNTGYVPVAEGPQLYQTCDVCFLPTVLETFTATYPEAMAMNLPIVTSDLGFARDICRDAALYFEPNNVKSAVEQLLLVVKDQRIRDRLTQSGKSVLAELPTPNEQYRRYAKLLSELVGSES